MSASTQPMPPPAPPRQERSRRSMERILRATEDLLETRNFQEISVADIVRRARASIGTFYARFSDKDALLPLLYDRQGAALSEERERFLASASWPSLSLAEIAERLVREMVVGFRRQENLMRAIALYSRMNGGAITEERRAKRAVSLQAAHQLLLTRRAEIAHDDPERAVEFGLFIVGASCREKILFGSSPHARSTPVSDKALVRELTRAFVAYLQSKP